MYSAWIRVNKTPKNKTSASMSNPECTTPNIIRSAEALSDGDQKVSYSRWCRRLYSTTIASVLSQFLSLFLPLLLSLSAVQCDCREAVKTSESILSIFLYSLTTEVADFSFSENLFKAKTCSNFSRGRQ